MTQELIYTSVPRGLKTGLVGFCTVASTPGMSSTLADRLESLSGYRHLFPAHDPRSAQNPINYSHYRIKVGPQEFHVLSRICDAGLDYSKRSNKLAHHVALTTTECVPAGPGALLAAPGFMETQWQGEPRILPTGRKPPQVEAAAQVCRAWQALTGDAGWAGVLAEGVFASPPRPTYIIYPLGTDALTLITESLALLPPDKRWQVTFSSVFTKPLPGMECQWRFLVDGQPEAQAARRSPQWFVIDLCNPLPAAQGGHRVEAARTGRLPQVERHATAPAPVAPATHAQPAPLKANPDVAAADLPVSTSPAAAPVLRTPNDGPNPRLQAPKPRQYAASAAHSNRPAVVFIKDRSSWVVPAAISTLVLALVLAGGVFIYFNVAESRRIAEVKAAEEKAIAARAKHDKEAERNAAEEKAAQVLLQATEKARSAEEKAKKLENDLQVERESKKSQPEKQRLTQQPSPVPIPSTPPPVTPRDPPKIEDPLVNIRLNKLMRRCIDIRATGDHEVLALTKGSEARVQLELVDHEGHPVSSEYIIAKITEANQDHQWALSHKAGVESTPLGKFYIKLADPPKLAFRASTQFAIHQRLKLNALWLRLIYNDQDFEDLHFGTLNAKEDSVPFSKARVISELVWNSAPKGIERRLEIMSTPDVASILSNTTPIVIDKEIDWTTYSLPNNKNATIRLRPRNNEYPIVGIFCDVPSISPDGQSLSWQNGVLITNEIQSQILLQSQNCATRIDELKKDIKGLPKNKEGDDKRHKLEGQLRNTEANHMIVNTLHKHVTSMINTLNVTSVKYRLYDHDHIRTDIEEAKIRESWKPRKAS